MVLIVLKFVGVNSHVDTVLKSLGNELYVIGMDKDSPDACAAGADIVYWGISTTAGECLRQANTVSNTLSCSQARPRNSDNVKGEKA